jgi:hypothetical protein
MGCRSEVKTFNGSDALFLLLNAAAQEIPRILRQPKHFYPLQACRI